MIVHSDNENVRIHLREGVTFDGWSSHVEGPDGKHLFVLAVQPGSTDHLVAVRSLLPGALKKTFGILSNADLQYIERYPGGALYQVNLDNVGRGPGAFGEAEHTKTIAHSVSHDTVQARLGNVKMPVPPLPSIPPPGGTGTGSDLNPDGLSGGLPALDGKERDQVRQKAKQTYEPRL